VTFPKTGDTVSMPYTGTLASTGAKFDSSRDRGKEFSTQIGVGRVIDGWDQGVPQMSLGERAFLRISAACGYGAQGSPPTIPANADLVFDVELLGINGKRASTGAAVASLSTPSSAAVGRLPSSAPLGSLSSSTSLSGSASFGSAPLGTALPSCTASSCGHAISFDAASTSKPLCLCNPICVDWANQPGILPCCPGLQEVCLNPLLNKQSSAAAPAVNAAPANSVNAASSARSAPAVQSASSVAPAASALPTCRPNSCGKAMALGLNSLTAVCACDASCLVAGSSLPCCQSFREVCQSAPVSSITSQSQLAGSSAVSFGSQQPPSTSAQQSTASVQQTSASLPQSPASQTAAKPLASFPSATSVACTLGKTKWAEQKTCDKKRYAIQNNKCNKVCPPTDPQASANIKTWPTGSPGKQACAAALALCKGS